MAKLRLFNYIYGNYNDQRVRNVADLSLEFPDEAAVHIQDNVNISFNDGLMISLTVNVDDNLIERINYATITTDGVIRPYYVLSYVYLRNGQYELAMKLDTVLYKLDFIKNTRGNVFRGLVKQEDNVVLNNEGVEVTKVKVAEIPINLIVGNNEAAELGWYAVYADRKLGTGPDASDKLEFKLSNSDIIPDETYADLAAYPFAPYIDNPTLFFDMKESHVLQNTSFKTTVDNNLNFGIVFETTPQVYKIIPGQSIQYSNYLALQEYLGSGTGGASFVYANTARYQLDGKYKSAIRGSTKSGDIYTPAAYGQGLLRPTKATPVIGLLSSGMQSEFNNKRSNMNSRQISKTAIASGSQKTREQILAVDGKIIKIGVGFYQAKVETQSSEDYQLWANSNAYFQTYMADKIFNGSAAEQLIDNTADEVSTEIYDFTALVSEPISTTDASLNYPLVNYIINVTQVILTLIPLNIIGSGIVIGTFGDGSLHPKMVAGPGEEPYKLLLFPYGKVILENSVSSKEIIIGESIVRNIIANLIFDYPGAIFDVQKIPYSTINLDNYFVSLPDGYVVADTENEGDEMYALQDVDQPYALVFNAYQTTATITTFSYLPSSLKSGDRKLDSVTKMAQIMSPSHKTAYPYEYVKNNYKGAFKIYVDLKPFTPFVNIDFIVDPSGLYVSNYSDGRGLNIAENVSMTMFTDEFKAYVRNNSTYLQSFNSQQDYERDRLGLQQLNETTRNEIDKEQAWVSYGVSAAGNALNTAVAVGVGVATGGMGAAVGGVSASRSGTNLITGALQTAVDNQYRDKKLALQQGFAKDQLGLQQAQAKSQFQMGLQNLQSRPARLDKVSGVSMLHRAVPYIALYDTTLPEKERLQQYFKFNGYNINKIDVLGAYIDFDTPMSFLKASIIESNESVNNTILQDINQRLSVGVYFMKGN